MFQHLLHQCFVHDVKVVVSSATETNPNQEYKKYGHTHFRRALVCHQSLKTTQGRDIGARLHPFESEIDG